MKRLFLMLLFLSFGTGAAGQTGPMPKYLRDLDRPYHAGDWTLQCDSSRLCQIIGVARIPKDYVGVRAIVMIKRGAAKDAKPSLRIAFVDSMGSLGVPPPAEGWRLYSRGLPKMPPPIKLALGQPESDGAYRPSPEATSRLMSALTRWPGSVIHDRGLKIATMPRGDLARLLRTMERLQHPKKPRMTEAETAEWLKEYHYTILRASEPEMSPPDEVLLACDTRTYINRPQGVKVGPRRHLWTGDCPEGYKILFQEQGKEPVKFDVRDSKGKIRQHSYAGFNMGTSLVEVMLPRKAGDDCGRRIKLGFTGTEFAMVEDRRYDRCRAVPYEYWPVVWYPTSLKYADAPPQMEGMRPPRLRG
jgi:hypothetical protein